MSTFPQKLQTNAKKLWFRPHLPLADNIVSHSIRPLEFLAILEHYHLKDHGKVITRYYNDVQINEVNESMEKKCYTVFYAETHVDEGLSMEVVAVNQYDLSVMSFPLRLDYHHARQSIVFTKIVEPEVEIELEILVQGILDPKVRHIQISELLSTLNNESAVDDTENPVISLSFRLIVSPKKYVHGLKIIKTLKSQA